MTIARLVSTVLEYYRLHARAMPWRHVDNPYHVYISEVMLQQTQVTRVMQVYSQFIRRYPSFTTLAHATLTDVLRIWQGMGYNRRAKYMHETARIIVDTYAGILPHEPQVLITLPGIGVATAGSIACFAYNTRSVFIETNIRRVIIHHCFAQKNDVSDADITAQLHACLAVIDARDGNYRDWYYALMDYGAYLSKMVTNPNTRSAHYVKQSKFEGSDRQIRGKLLREYLQSGQVVLRKAKDKAIWNTLIQEGLVPTSVTTQY